MSEKPVCPRCLGYIPNNDMPGAHPGAMSRRTRGVPNDQMIYVCSACGVEEAIIQYTQGEATVLHEQWPIESDRKVNA